MMSPGDNLPKGVKLFFKMIQKCYKNKSIIPIIPTMCYSTDDTTDYIYECYGNNRKGTFRLVSNKSLKNAGSRSRYTIDNSKSMNGLRVKLTYTFSAAGTMAPIFISVLGLTERELPEDERIALKIEGLSVRGKGVTVGTKQCGILLLMRGQKGSNKKKI